MKLIIKENIYSYRIIDGPKKITDTEYDKYYAVAYGNHRYSVYDTTLSDDVFNKQYCTNNYKAQISKISPYDDAEYVWANVENGLVNFILDGKIIDTIKDISNDDDFEYNFEWQDNIFLTALENLEIYNKDIKPIMIYN